MANCLHGYSEIFDFLRVDYYHTDKQPGEKWLAWSERKAAELIARGFPIFFLPMIDREPRLYVPEAVEWLKTYREASLAKHYVMRRERDTLEAMKAEQEKAAEEAGTVAPVDEATEPEPQNEAEAVA